MIYNTFLICYDIMFQSLAYFSWTIVSTATWTPTPASQKDGGPQGRPATRWSRRTTGAQEVGRKLLPGLVSFIRHFFSLKLSELLKYLMKIVFLHFGLANQLEEDLVPGWRCCLFWRYDFIHLVSTEVLTEFSFSLPPCEPSSRAGSTWQGAWSSSQEQGLRLFPSVGIFPPLSCSHWSAWPLFQDGTSHKLS